MAEEKEMGGLKTHFKDAVASPAGVEGEGVTHGGCSIPGGEKATGGGRIPEVTYYKLDGAPGEGDSAAAGSSSIAGKDKKDVAY